MASDGNRDVCVALALPQCNMVRATAPTRSAALVHKRPLCGHTWVVAPVCGPAQTLAWPLPLLDLTALRNHSGERRRCMFEYGVYKQVREWKTSGWGSTRKWVRLSIVFLESHNCSFSFLIAHTSQQLFCSPHLTKQSFSLFKHHVMLHGGMLFLFNHPFSSFN